MSGTGLGIFVPSETAYKDPNRFRDVLMAEGNKEASYLAQMDQFYSQLDEMKREFDLSLSQRDKEFERTMAFNEYKLDWQSGENERDRDLKGSELSMMRDINMGRLDAEKDFNFAQMDLKRTEMDMIKESNLFFQGLYRAEESRKEAEETRTQGTYDAASRKFGIDSSGLSAQGEADMAQGYRDLLEKYY